MIETDAFFKNRRPVPEQLLRFGFIQNADGYRYGVPLLGGQFELSIVVTTDGAVQTGVTDTLSGEAYTLHHVAGAAGGFVGSVREAYAAQLTMVNAACFVPDVFKSDAAREVIRYVRETRRDELEFLWRRFPENAVFRRQDNRKWYGALLTVRGDKLGLNGQGRLEILDLRARPDEIAALVDGTRYFPGYHMNKRHWLTILLDGSVPMAEIRTRIDASFQLAQKA